MLKFLSLLLLCGAAQAAATETWLVTLDRWGNHSYQTLTLERNGDALRGDIGGDQLTGKRQGRSIEFDVVDANQARYAYRAQVDGAAMRGSADFPDTNNPAARAQHAFSARRLPERPAGPPRRYEFTPSDYANEFSAHRAPVLTIWPGDTVHTKTIDSGGVDEQGVTRALYGNPQTGPFFIAGAEQGDTLVVRLRRLRLNRDYADSLDTIVGRALTVGMAAKAAGLGKPVRWKLDRERGLASPEQASAGLARFAVPVRPMLGGLAVAPGDGPGISTGDTGRFGGNMDFNEVVEGNTVYLPVQQPGALLYLGDAHALQGDGETSQYALETSMDVEFDVDVIKGKAIGMPRVESPTQIMTLGQAGSLDDALRAATSGMLQWLQQDYGLSLSECAQVLGSAVKYSVPNLAGRSVGVAAKLDKTLLKRPGSYQ
ncbi:acetamidase/formamidase family protein [Duganella sp. CT11-25]|uniref:acetamidase/formamidase family protein n=1 Tax=unclassified Duganella TaxID=2636909 RepID=UPI0039B0D8A2